MKRFLFALSLFLCIASIAQPRFTDSTFGTNGNVTKNTSAPYKNVIDMVQQPDGKSVVLAEASYNGRYRVALLRYTTNGNLDNTFSGNGIADSSFDQNNNFRPAAIRLQADGKILVCGRTGGFPNSAFVVRYLPNGNPDVGFGSSGIFYEPLVKEGNISYAVSDVADMALLPDGRLLLVSSTYGVTTTDLVLTRLKSTGRADSTFGINGLITLDASSSFSPQWTKVEVQADGKILVGGNPNEYQQTSGTYITTAILRFNANGAIDNSYGTNGRATLQAGGEPYNILKDIILQADGKLLLSGVGQTYSYLYSYCFVARLNTSGTTDVGFGSGGRYTFQKETGLLYNDDGLMSTQADGKILLAGYSSNGATGFNMAMARLTTNGQPDASFGINGYASLPIGSYSSFATAAQQQPDGNLVMSGLARNGSTGSATIARLSATGQPDPTLNAVAAIAYIGSGTDSENGLCLQRQPDGKILTVNTRYTGAGNEVTVSRYNADGTPDNTFAATSVFEAPIAYCTYFSGLPADGKLMVAVGFFGYYSGSGVLIARLNTDGNMDSSFGTNGKLFIKTRNIDFSYRVPQVAFQDDGKTVLLYAQLFGRFPALDSSFLVRLNPNGSFDNSFNGNGKKYLPDSSYSQYTALGLQPDRKILISEYRGNGGYAALRRISADGSADNSFNNGNTVAFPFETSSIDLQADGKILIGGDFSTIARLNINGSTDSSFGTGGIVKAQNYFATYNSPSSIQESNSNRLVFAGLTYDTVTYQSFPQLMALKKNGTPDSSFGNMGIVQMQDISVLGSSSSSFGIQPDQKILYTSYVQPANSYTYSAVLTRRRPVATFRLYTFTGSGLWSNPANWADGTVPPTTIPAGSSIVIDPLTGSECVIDITVQVQTGASVTIKAGKKVRLPGNLIIQ